MWRWSYLVASHPWWPPSILHVCGGDPNASGTISYEQVYSPRMWRWSWIQLIVNVMLTVFSTYVEVIPYSPNLFIKWECILHVCGGDPTPPVTLLIRSGYSPRMWRWSYWYFLWVMVTGVFSTYVEVIPRLWSNGSWSSCILHVCGGDPARAEFYTNFNKYSPRMWRWSTIWPQRL